MPFKILGEYDSKKGTKKLTVEYEKGLHIIKRENPINFDLFLDALKKEEISVLYLGYGIGSIEKEFENPNYDTLQKFFNNRVDEFFKLEGSLKMAAVDKTTSSNFYIESEVSPARRNDLRLHANVEVARQLESLLK